MKSHVPVHSRSDIYRQFGIDLSPCPFCGCKHPEYRESPYPCVTCPVCNADGPFVDKGDSRDHYNRLRQCFSVWNSRATT